MPPIPEDVVAVARDVLAVSFVSTDEIIVGNLGTLMSISVGRALRYLDGLQSIFFLLSPLGRGFEFSRSGDVFSSSLLMFLTERPDLVVSLSVTASFS